MGKKIKTILPDARIKTVPAITGFASAQPKFFRGEEVKLSMAWESPPLVANAVMGLVFPYGQYGRVEEDQTSEMVAVVFHNIPRAIVEYSSRRTNPVGRVFLVPERFLDRV
jgi:hypothetical protein